MKSRAPRHQHQVANALGQQLSSRTLFRSLRPCLPLLLLICYLPHSRRERPPPTQVSGSRSEMCHRCGVWSRFSTSTAHPRLEAPNLREHPICTPFSGVSLGSGQQASLTRGFITCSWGYLSAQARTEHRVPDAILEIVGHFLQTFSQIWSENPSPGIKGEQTETKRNLSPKSCKGHALVSTVDDVRGSCKLHLLIPVKIYLQGFSLPLSKNSTCKWSMKNVSTLQYHFSLISLYTLFLIWNLHRQEDNQILLPLD